VFLWAKRLIAKGIHKEMLPVYGGKCLSHKAVHNWVKKFSQGPHVSRFISICDYLLTLSFINRRGTAFWPNLEKHETHFSVTLSGEYSLQLKLQI
jgi:hypothetical protein